MRRSFRPLSAIIVLACGVSLLAVQAPALADPPPWANAKGHHAKHSKKVQAKHHRAHRNDEPVYWEDADHVENGSRDEQVYDDQAYEDRDGGRYYEADREQTYPRPSFRGYERATRPSSFSGGRCVPRPTAADAGAALGAGLAKQVTGDNAASAALGGVLGAVLGSQIDARASAADEDCTYQVLDRAADRERIAWEDTGSATHYELTPIRSFSRSGEICREFVTHRVQRGKLLEIHRTACRDRAGVWHIED
jgi:surface antigen